MDNSTAALRIEEIDRYYDDMIRAGERRCAVIRAGRAARAARNRVIILSLISLMFLCLGATFIRMSFSITQKIHSVAVLEKELNLAVLENEDTRRRIEDSVNPLDIRKEALSFGMSYPSQDKLVYYNVTKEDYMNQHIDFLK